MRDDSEVEATLMGALRWLPAGHCGEAGSMKAISSSIIVLAAAIMITGGAMINGNFDDELLAIGSVVGLIGMISWIGAFLEK